MTSKSWLNQICPHDNRLNDCPECTEYVNDVLRGIETDAEIDRRIEDRVFGDDR